MGSCCCRPSHNDNVKAKVQTKKLTTPAPAPVYENRTQWIPSSTQSNPSLKMSSTPSQIPTNELTVIYTLPSKEFWTEEEVIRSHGYQLLNEVAKGGFAKIFKAKNISNNTIIACKVLDLTDDEEDGSQKSDTKNEVFVMERTSHPNIIKLFEHFMIRDNNSYKERVFVYIWMQWASGGSLSKLMRESEQPLTELRAKVMFAQIVVGVRHMHQKGIAHRDLKMGNILLDDKQNVLVSDFGLSRVAYRVSKGGTVMSHTYCGTIPYMAPEVLVNRTGKKIYYNPFGADIWAMGIILYCIINKAYPFDESSGFDEMIECQKKSKWKYSRYIRCKPSEQLSDAINHMLEPNCSKRITIAQLADHSWIRDEVNKLPV